jgi:superfamily I DNA/RNA helicase
MVNNPVGATVSSGAFFALADEILLSLERGALGEVQKSVITVRDDDRVLQILAGPGSGKTETLVWRVLYEVFVLGTESARIVVTTFTKRAATELEIRLVERTDEFLKLGQQRGMQIADPQIHNLRIGTIHSLCDSFLAEFDDAYMEAGTELINEFETGIRLARVYRYKLGFSSPPAAPRTINRIVARETVVALFRSPWEDDPQWPRYSMDIVLFVNALLSQHVETWYPRCSRDNLPHGAERVHGLAGLTQDLSTLQSRWEEYLNEHAIIDFTTVQKRFLEKQELMAGRFDHIFVDEFQDSNPIQFAIHTRWLAEETARVTVVGDDDQAIYRFRGSDIECFRGLEPFCKSAAVAYRRETLSVNYRSTRNIVRLAEAYRSETVLRQLSMEKQIQPAPGAPAGVPVRLLTGDWQELCTVTARELRELGVGRHPVGDEELPSAALLMFSMSEKQPRDRNSPALTMRRAIQQEGMRVYNPRNKMAGSNESPVAMLLGLLSYLIDPVSMAPVGKKGRNVEVWGSNHDPSYAQAARTRQPGFFINQRHAALQKAFLKGEDGRIGAPAPMRAPLVAFVDHVRGALAALGAGDRGRLTLAGFVARLLVDPLFRNSGFTVSMFRQALFTQLLESNIAPTRLTIRSLDDPLEVQMNNGKFEWDERYWTFLNIFGSYLEANSLDDIEVEAFEEDAVLMITFHQAKGLEFDHIYVGGMGRGSQLGPALRSRLFSGEAIPYTVVGGLATVDQHTNLLAEADREREVYVALTRGKKQVTILHDPRGENFMAENAAIATMFSRAKPAKHVMSANIEVRELNYG